MSLRIALTGSTGFIGRKIKQNLEEQGHQLVDIWRSDLEEHEKIRKKINQTDILINLAGKPIMIRWTMKNRKEIYQSRIFTVRKLAESIREMKNPPKHFINASAIGIYNDVAEHTEASDAYASDFLSRVVKDWEDEAIKIKDHGIDVTILRLGIVLGNDGGALGKMLPLFRCGLGGRIGRGKQEFSFIHCEDLVRAIGFIMNRKNPGGIYNLVSPQRVTNEIFVNEMARILNRPAFFHVPETILKIIIGESSIILTKGQKVIPKQLLDEGFVFKYPEIGKCLENLLIK